MATDYPSRFTALESIHRSRKLEKPLPSPPSPTLTNPDLVLPASNSHDARPSTAFPSHINARPPSPSYLLDNVRDGVKSSMSAAGHPSHPSQRHLTAQDQARALKGRASSAQLVRRSSGRNTDSNEDSDGDASTERGSTISSDYGSVLRSTPASLQTPEYSNRHNGSSTGGSSHSSDEYGGVSQFLAKYRRDGSNEDDSEREVDNDTNNGDDTASARHSISVSVIENGIEVQRRIQEEEEHTSAILSRRAEEILANAKRRLNLMEGNLRGARDLVAPLTAANLKRAASMSSTYHAPLSTQSRFLYGTSDNGHTPSEPVRGSTLGPDYHGHYRNYSDVQAAERSTSKTPTISRRLPVHVTETPWTASLRASKSYDSLGSHVRGRASPAKVSLDSPLETLQEDERYDERTANPSLAFDGESVTGLGISRDCATPDDLRSQMSSLKGRISALRQRAQEDSSRRRSIQSLRTVSSMASLSDRDRVYESARASPVPTTTSYTLNGVSNTGDSIESQMWRPDASVLTSRNAFAEQAARQSGALYSIKALPALPNSTGYVQSAAHKAIENWRTDHAIGLDEAIPVSARDSRQDILYEDTEPESGCDEASEDGTSVYEDADTGIEADRLDEDLLPTTPAIVAHEDRIDAFDYQQFFVSSAINAYGPRRGSTSSDGSTSSTSTAKRPSSDRGKDADTFDPTADPPPTPQTPERLREIERGLQHSRAPSSASLLTVATFKTAREHREPRYPSWSTTMPTYSRPQTAMERPQTARISSESFQQPRPHTVMDEHRPLRERTSSSLGRDSDSDRADSGVGFSKRSPNEGRLAIKPSSIPLTPPMSPTDPVARAVNALLDPNGRTLGLKEKALLFGAVENLRQVALRLQRSDEVSLAARTLRQNLDDARRVLEASNVNSSQA